MTDIEYLPYKAVNVFINREYLDQLLESVLNGYNKLSKEKQIAFVKLFRQHVNVLGFRNAIMLSVPPYHCRSRHILQLSKRKMKLYLLRSRHG